LCGFANLSSIGIQIGGIGALAPSRKDDLARLGFRAMLAGTMANLLSAAIVAMLL
jgi:CNT family concentrative nucleoside transporter